MYEKAIAAGRAAHVRTPTEEHMLDGNRFRADCEKAVQEINEGLVGRDPAAASRASKWAQLGAEAIDDNNADRATRYLLALIGNLSDQNVINTQAVIQSCTRWILIPLWVSALALLWIALNS
jgi:hypothetical protein